MTESQWYDLIAKWEASGTTQKHFCELHGISYTDFKTWRTKGIATGKFQASYHSPKPSSGLFSPITISEPKACSDHIELHLPHGILLKLPVDF